MRPHLPLNVHCDTIVLGAAAGDALLYSKILASFLSIAAGVVPSEGIHPAFRSLSCIPDSDMISRSHGLSGNPLHVVALTRCSRQGSS